MKRTPGPKILDCRIPIAMDRLEADWFESNLTAELPIFNQAAKIHPSSNPSRATYCQKTDSSRKKTSAPKTGPIKKQFLGSRTKAPHSWPQIYFGGWKPRRTHVKHHCHRRCSPWFAQLGKRNTFYTSKRTSEKPREKKCSLIPAMFAPS